MTDRILSNYATSKLKNESLKFKDHFDYDKKESFLKSLIPGINMYRLPEVKESQTNLKKAQKNLTDIVGDKKLRIPGLDSLLASPIGLVKCGINEMIYVFNIQMAAMSVYQGDQDLTMTHLALATAGLLLKYCDYVEINKEKSRMDNLAKSAYNIGQEIKEKLDK